MAAATRDALRAFARSAYGLALPEGRVVSLERAIAQARAALDLPDDEALLRRLEAGDEAALGRYAGALTVGETYFFRHAAHFELARAHLRALAAGPLRRVRVWSAGCATGEEAWSLAIAAREAFGAEGFGRVEVLGTDLNRASLDHARRGVYRPWSFREGYAPDPRWFERAGDCWRVADVVRDAVTFSPLNLARRAAPPGAFELVFCRNVLLYFDVASTARAASLLAASLAPDGLLVPGPTDPPLDGLAALERLPAGGALAYRAARRAPSARVEAPRAEAAPPPAAPALPVAAPAPAPPLPPADGPLGALDDAVARDPLDVGAWLQRSIARLDLSDPHGAAEDAGRALLLDRRAPYAHVVAAMAALGAGDRAATRRHARNAEALLRGAPDEAPVPHAAGETASALRWLCAHLGDAKGAA